MTGTARRVELLRRGWTRFEHDPEIAAWSSHARAPALALAAETGAEFRCGGTWFPGVNILPNNQDARLAGEEAPPLAGAPVRFIADHLGLSGFAYDRAQVSICYPGYPRHGAEETEAAFRYRRDRDAAHVDGLLRETLARRRKLGEAHAFILGLPLSDAPPAAAPLVVWEGSHELMRVAFRAAFAGRAPAEWPSLDVTEIYQKTRREAFERCRRVEIAARPGESYIVHRLALHGVAPWRAPGDGEPRAIAYFRPNPWPGSDFGWWLERP